MSKISTIREMKQQSREKAKEDAWNNRFYLSKIPKYDSYTDPNCKLYSLYGKPVRCKSYNAQKENSI